MDELALLRSFRAAVPERDQEARDRVRRRVLRRHRPTRTWVLVAAAVVAFVAASSAFGLTSRLVHAVAGEPAPTPVREAFPFQDDGRPREFPIFRRSGAMAVIKQQAHGVMGIDTSAGHVIVWAAPTKGGGRCLMIDIVRLRRRDGVPNAGVACSPAPLRDEVPAVFGVSGTRVGESYLELVQGEVSVGVASVELRYPHGAREILPVYERFFIGELRNGMRPSLMITRDENGNEIKRRSASSPLRVGRGSIPEPTGPERVLIRLQTSSGHALTFSVAPAEDGQICQITRYRGSVGRGCGPDPRTQVEPDELQVHPGLWNEAEDGKPLVSLNGVVGAAIATLELRYRGGASTPVGITERFVYFEIPPAHRNEGRFVLIGRDTNGREIARRVVN